MSNRRAIHTFAATFVGTLALNGCNQAEPVNPPPGSAEPGAIPGAPPVAAPAAPATPAAPAGATWTSMSGEQGVALLLTNPNGDGVMQLACLRDGKKMVVRVAGFAPVASEERLSLGVDDDPMIFVAQLDSPGPGVQAEAPIPSDLLARLAAARTVGVNYGSQNLGPLAPPPPGQARAFEADCKAIAAG